MKLKRNLRKISRKGFLSLCLILLCACLTAGVLYQYQSKEVTLVVAGKESKISTMKFTVAELLQEQNIVLRESDRVVPAGNERLSDEMLITVYYSVPYTLTVEGVTSRGQSSAATVQDLLLEAAVQCGGMDLVQPEAATPLKENMEIRVIRVRQETVSERVRLPFDTISVASNDLFVGQQRITTAGRDGIALCTYLVTTEDGTEVARQLLRTEEQQTMSNQIVEYGTQTQTQLANGDLISFSQVAYMTTTGYCSCSLCCGKDPGDYGYGITASGRAQGYGVVGVDTSRIPFGTRLYVEGYGYAVAGDTGGAIAPNHLDLGFDSHADAVAWAKRNVAVYFLSN
ncbi:MAG: G5 domain-containing protein [Negativicutes bacterium]|nr:G5 domain-containing protein [Negativicutes bacterium]